MTQFRGRVKKERPLMDVRELTREDLEVLKKERPKVPAVQRFRDPHHRLARLIAMGLPLTECAARSGYSVTRASILNTDPAFQELISRYRSMADDAFREEQDDYMEMVASNRNKAEAMIAEKLEAAEESGDLLPTRELLAIARDAADRTGYGKNQTNVNVNVDFAAMLEKAIQRSGKVINARPVQPGALAPPRAQQLAPAVSESPPLRRRA